MTDVTWVMVITWSNMIPRLYYSDLVDKVTMGNTDRVITVNVFSAIIEVAFGYTALKFS